MVSRKGKPKYKEEEAMSGKVNSTLVSDLVGGFLENFRMWQEFGMTESDFKELRKDRELSKEVFRIIRDSVIFKNRRLIKKYEREDQIELFREWNKELNLCIPVADFQRIPEEFPYPPMSTNESLYCTCLVYELGDPLETLLFGMRILNYELKKINGEFKIDHSLGGETLLNERQGMIPYKQVRIRPGAHARKRGFRFIVAELGRASFPDKPELGKNDAYKFAKLIKENEANGLKFIGQELPFIGAMYPGWITSVCGESPLYHRPLALDIQISWIYKDFYPEHTGALCLTEEENSSFSSPAYGRNKPFCINIEDFKYEYWCDGILGNGYGVCTIVDEV